MNKPSISIIILHGKNSSPKFEECLKSISWATEIIIVDDEMPEEALKIARGFKASIFKLEQKENNFAAKRNFGAKKAQGDWIFYLDNDEIVTPELAQKIKEVVSSADYSVYEILRRNFFFNHEMKHGGWSPDYVLRLFQKEALIAWKGELHEQPQIKGKVGKLNQAILHYTHRNLSEMVEKTNEWSNIEAQLLFDAGHPPMAWWRFVSIAVREFWYRAILKLGFLDGPVGIIEIVYQMYSRMITYAKLWELQTKAQSYKK